MTAQAQSVKQASEQAKAAADAAYGNVAGIERADQDKSAETARLHEFVEAINAAVPRKVGTEGVAIIERTYRLPEPPPDAERQARFEAWLAAGEPTPGDVAVSDDPGAPLRVRTVEGWAPITPDRAAMARDLNDAAEIAERANVRESERTGLAGPNGNVATTAPLDYATTGQTTRAGLEPDVPGVTPLRVEPRDPVEMAERGVDDYVGVCRLCPQDAANRVVIEAEHPSGVRARMSAHMRKAHGRSPWPGSQ
jgi:hypothetical protein